MDETTRKALTVQYLHACEKAWSRLRAGDAEIPLASVFVMLQAVASPPPRPLDRRPDLPDIPERREHAGIAPDGKEGHRQPAPTPVPLSIALAEAQHMALLGEPGAGKSTTLQFIGLCFAHTGWTAERLSLLENRIPIRLELRLFAGDLWGPGCTLEDCLASAVNAVIDHPLASELVRYWRDTGQLLVLLDGLDEVPEAQRPAVQQKIADFTFRAGADQCRLVVSSRIAGFVSLGASLKEFTLKPFRKAEEARPYLKCWLEALQAIPGEQAEQQAEELLAKMQAQPALARLLDNPLLLRLAAEIFARNGEIAKNRTDLYARWVETTWQRAVQRGADPHQKENALHMLDELAWGLHTGQEISIAIDYPLLREKMGMVIQSGDKFVFSHTTQQEYFVGQRLRRAWVENRLGAWSFLKPRLHLPEWQEPVLLMAGGLDQSDASELARRVLQARSAYEHPLRRDLSMSAALVGEGVQLEKGVQAQILSDCRKALTGGRHSISERLRAAEAFGKVGGAQALAGLLLALGDKNRDVRYAAVNVVGKVGGEKAVAGLSAALRDQAAFVRQAAADALGEVGGVEAAVALESAPPDEDEYVRGDVLKALGKTKGAAAVESLSMALSDESEDVRLSAVDALAEIGDTKALAVLLATVQEPYSLLLDVRLAAARALGRIGNQAAAPALMAAMQEEEMRRTAAEALESIGDAQAAAGQRTPEPDNKDKKVSWATAQALERQASFLPIPRIDSEIRQQIAVMRKMVNHERSESDAWLAAIQRLDALQARLSPYQDPFLKPATPLLARTERAIWIGLATLLLLGVVAALELLSDILKDALKSEMLNNSLTWLKTHLYLALGGYILLVVLTMVIGRWVDSLRKQAKSAN